MNCIKCGAKSRVYESRPEGETMMRRRECLSCKTRYQTIEILKPIKQVLKKKPEKKPEKKPKLRVVKPKKMKFEDLDLASMTDEEIEAAISSGNYI